jgi:hypothetical protein
MIQKLKNFIGHILYNVHAPSNRSLKKLNFYCARFTNYIEKSIESKHMCLNVFLYGITQETILLNSGFF